MADEQRRTTMVAAVLVIGWLVVTLAGAGAAAAFSGMGDLGCEAAPQTRRSG